MSRTTRRVSRRFRSCGCGHGIRPGDVYLSHVCSPNHDGLGNVGWWRLAECAECATRYGRGELVAS